MNFDPLDALFAKQIGGEGSLPLMRLFRSFREGAHSVVDPTLEPFAPPPDGDFPSTPLVRDLGHIYLQKNWVYEKLLVREAMRIRHSTLPPLWDQEQWNDELLANKKLLSAQREAVQRAFDHSLFILSGGPGTGKTYTAVQFLRLLFASLRPKKRFHLAIAAPVGRGAFHLEKMLQASGPIPQTVSWQTTTLHSLLSLKPGDHHPWTQKKIDADLILIDEASMIDTPLLVHLFASVRSGCRLFLMGDPDQLPPIGTASLFAPLAAFFGFSLSECMRTDSNTLQTLAASIRTGDVEQVLRLLKEESPHVQEQTPPWDSSLYSFLFEKVAPYRSREKPDVQQAWAHSGRFRLLNAIRQGPFGADQINQEIISHIERVRKGGEWCALPVLMRGNDPARGLFNGMEGLFVTQHPLPLKRGELWLSENEPCPTPFPPFEYTFCLSIHKSQGSEFKTVLALFPPGSEHFGRESLYTAVTRARQRFEWMGEVNRLAAMIGSVSQRGESLLRRLNEGR